MTDQTHFTKSKAGWYLLIGTIAWALAPLAIEISNAGETPFLFNAWLELGIAGGTIVFIILYIKVVNKQFFSEEENKIQLGSIIDLLKTPGKEKEAKTKFGSLINQLWHRKILTWAIIGRTNIAFLALAAGFVATEIATVLYETWIIFFIIIRGLNSHKLKNDLNLQNIILFIFALGGLLFINLAQTGLFSSINTWGLLISLAGAILSAISLERSVAYGEKFSNNDIDQNASKNKYKTADQIKVETVYTLMATVVMDIFAAVLSLIVALFFHNFAETNISSFEDYFSLQFILILLFGLTFGAIASIGYRKGNLEASSLKTNSISYFMPIFAVIALWVWDLAAGENIRIERIDYFLIGLSVVTAVNLLLNYSIEVEKLGFKWLVISFWTSSMIILLRDRWFWLWRDNNDWLWEGSTDYYAVLGLSTTVFVLVLSFRTVRLNERTRHENHLLSSLYWKTKQYNNNEKALEALRKIDESETLEQFDSNYIDVRKSILSQDTEQNFDDTMTFQSVEEASMMHSQLDELSHSKARGKDIAEPLILIAFGVSTIAITLMTRPKFSDWNLFLSDIFSVLFASTICFMIFNLFDLRAERSKPVLWPPKLIEQNSKADEPKHEKNESSAFEIFISFILSAIVVLVFIIILYGKWVVDWEWTSLLLPDDLYVKT